MALPRLSMFRGDSQTYSLTFKRTDDTLYNIKNWSIAFTLKSSWSLPDSEAVVQKIVTTFDDTASGTSGSANITLTPSDTVSLDVKEYDFDIQVTTASSEVYTVFRGRFNLLSDVTRTAGTAGSA